MSLEERTLVVRNLDGNQVSKSLLFELFNQAGPVVNVVLRPDFAFIEFEHKVSVGYSLALMEGIQLFGRQLLLQPKLRDDPSFYKFVEDMNRFNQVMAQTPDYFVQFMPNNSVQSYGPNNGPNSYGQNRDNTLAYRDHNRHRFQDNNRRHWSESQRHYSGSDPNNRYGDRKRHSNDYF